jgi:signal transduction histidine kinase
MKRTLLGRAGDLTVAGVFAVLAVADVVLANRHGGSPPRTATVFAGLLVTAVALAWRSALPKTVLGVTAVGGAVAAAAADRPVIGPLPVAVALYTLATVSTWRTAATAASAASACYFAGVLAGHATGGDASPGPAAAQVLALLVIGGTLGLYVGQRQQVMAVLTERAEHLQRERQLLTAQAILAERVWIAQELHDVIGHHVSLLVVQAGAVRSTLPADHPTGGVLDSMIEGGREAMTEMRRLVDVLRPVAQATAHDVPGHGPAPDLTDLTGLCRRLRTTGLPVDLDFQVSVPLPRAHSVTAYRIVQEALTNVLKHAGHVPTRVQIRRDATGLELRVTNSAAPPSATTAPLTGPQLHGLGSGGHGLAGMRHRVDLFGGELFAGPVPGGGYALRATLPLQERP